MPAPYRFDVTIQNAEIVFQNAVTGDLALKAGVRFRDAFNDANNDSTRTYRLGAEYALDKNQTLSVGFDRSLGNAEFNAFSAGYGIKF